VRTTAPPGRGLARGGTPAIRTDTHGRAWDREGMNRPRKQRKAFDLFVEALVHPVRFR